MIATPTMTGDVCHEYVSALVGMMADLNSRGVAIDLRFYPGCCYLELARNELASQFMASDCDKLLFIDADIGGYRPDSAWKLIETACDIVGGLYRFKLDAEGYPSTLKTHDSGHPLVRNGRLSVSMLPTGFMMISRDVFECLQIRFPARQMRRPDGTTLWNYFPQGQEGQEWVGEDVRFCRMWIECGGDIWVVPDLDFVHVGRKAFYGNWHEYAQRLPGGHLGPPLEKAA